MTMSESAAGGVEGSVFDSSAIFFSSTTNNKICVRKSKMLINHGKTIKPGFSGTKVLGFARLGAGWPFLQSITEQVAPFSHAAV